MEQKEIQQEQQRWLKVAATEEFGHRQDVGPDEDLLWHEGHYQVEVRMEEGWFPSGDPTPATCPKEPDGGCASMVPRLPRRGRCRERKGGRMRVWRSRRGSLYDRTLGTSIGSARGQTLVQGLLWPRSGVI
ncbi:UNVERIFIED_CONTAM: hypothetical protein FKN15_007688 [Acipenser sinensis]